MTDDANHCMLISVSVLCLFMGYEVYSHMKAFYIAIGLPFSGRGKIRCYHIFGSIILSVLAILQVFLTKSLMYISFYQIIGSR